MNNRWMITLLLWLAYLATVFFFGEWFNLGGGVIALALVLVLPLMVVTVSMWSESYVETKARAEAEKTDYNTEKRKRDRLDAILRDLSDEQLMALKLRLTEPDFEDEVSYMLGDDGELITDQA